MARRAQGVEPPALGSGLDEDAFYLDELGPRTLDRFEAVLLSEGEDPADYRYLPCTRGSGSTGWP